MEARGLQRELPGGRVVIGILVGAFFAVFLYPLCFAAPFTAERLPLVGFWLLAVVGFYALLIGSYVREKRRTAAMQRFATQRGWRFDARGTTFDFQPWTDLPFFREIFARWIMPDDRRARNVISGADGSTEIFVFDYFRSGARQNVRGGLWSTVVCMRSASLALPRFTVDPWYHPSAAAGGVPAAVLEFLRPHPGYGLQAAGDHLVVWRQTTRIFLLGVFARAMLTTPEDVSRLVEDSRSILGLLRGELRHSNQP